MSLSICHVPLSDICRNLAACVGVCHIKNIIDHRHTHRVKCRVFKFVELAAVKLNKRKIMNYEKLSVINTGSNAGLYAKCYFHMQVMYHNLFSFYVLFIKCFREC